MNIIILIIFYLLFISFDVLSLVREKKKRKLYVYSIFMSFSFIISLLLVLGINVPSYDKFVGKVIYGIFGKQ